MIGHKQLKISESMSINSKPTRHPKPLALSLSNTACLHYPFGMSMQSYSNAEFNYSYGMNTQEKDNEIYGEGNSYTAEFWQYDARLGRRWNVDPVVKTHESPYATFANNPIWFVDVNGDDTTVYVNFSGLKNLIYEKYANSSFDPEKVYEYQKQKFVQQMRDIYKANGIGLNIVETDLEFNEVKSSLNPSDSYLEFGKFGSHDKKGDLKPLGFNEGYYSAINLDVFKFLGAFDANNSFATYKMANTGVHETFHGLIDRAIAEKGKKLSDFGFDMQGHYNAKNNIMMSGSVRHILGSGLHTDFLPKKNTTEYSKILLLPQHSSIIKNFMIDDQRRTGIPSINNFPSQFKIAHRTL